MLIMVFYINSYARVQLEITCRWGRFLPLCCCCRCLAARSLGCGTPAGVCRAAVVEASSQRDRRDSEVQGRSAGCRAGELAQVPCSAHAPCAAPGRRQGWGPPPALTPLPWPSCCSPALLGLCTFAVNQTKCARVGLINSL